VGEAVQPGRVGLVEAAAADPYAAYADRVADYDVDTPDLDWVLPPFVVGLLAVAGRLLAVLAYRDAFVLADRPLNRRSAKAKATVFAHLPPSSGHGVTQRRAGGPQPLQRGRAAWAMIAGVTSGAEGGLPFDQNIDGRDCPFSVLRLGEG
jgi:hypothetical protein